MFLSNCDRKDTWAIIETWDSETRNPGFFAAWDWGGGQHTILPSFQKKNPHEIKNILVGRARDGAGEGRCAPPPYPPIIGLY